MVALDTTYNADVFSERAGDRSADRQTWGRQVVSRGERIPVPQECSMDANESDMPAIAVASMIVSARAQRERRFKRLVSEWKEQRNGYSSDPTVLAMCPPYQKIIAMGPEAIPLLLRELERRPDHWFWALSMLTDSNPVLPGHAGDFREMVSDWLVWGRENGFLRD